MDNILDCGVRDVEGEVTKSAYIFTVLQLPPSRNHYVKTTRKGGHKTDKAICFEKEMWAMGVQARQGGMGFQRCRVEITLRMNPGRKLDIDNAPKLVLDGLKLAGFYADDSAVWQMLVTRENTFGREETHIQVSETT